jgi:hypothetical protein
MGEVPAFEVGWIFCLGTRVFVGSRLFHHRAAFEHRFLVPASKLSVLGSRFGLDLLRGSLGAVPVSPLW